VTTRDEKMDTTGANPAAVQRILRHSDPRITTETYGHLVPGYLRAEVDRLAFGAPAESSHSQDFAGSRSPLVTPLLQGGRRGQRKEKAASRGAREKPPFRSVGHEGLEPSASGLRVRCSTN
jgi:hypothetical protein